MFYCFEDIAMPFKGRELVAGRRRIGGESMSSPSEAKSKCQINIASCFHQNKVHSRNKLVPNQFSPHKAFASSP